ncbi:MAG: hypothetical protein GF347_00575 [Candidatus Moranbacteria bacterium]|nr:hypothetical protein [Candidatus Moranbacteria bacterium]
MDRLEREWERQVETDMTEAEIDPAPTFEQSPLPPKVKAVKEEAETILAEKASRVPFSIQSPSDDDPLVLGGGGLVWWSGGTLDTYIPVSEYGDPKRMADLRAFALIAPLILVAESILAKKVQSLQWTVEGGRNLAAKWQKTLNNFEGGAGWDYFIARWIRAYSESDQPAYVELIRDAPSWAVDDNFKLTPRGERAIERGDDRVWPISDARVMDPLCCDPTRSREYPLIYRNLWTGKRYQLRTYQFMSIVDTPSVDDLRPHAAVCAVSRAVWAAQEDRMVTRFFMERISENPGAGIVSVNASDSQLRTALSHARAEREARGVVYYKGMIFLPVMDPTGGTRLEFLNFSELPAGFDRGEMYNILKEVVASSFGLDVLEFGSIPGRLGTATQAKVAAQKGRTKSIGAIMQGVERAFRYKLLPESVTFSIKKHDQDEELQRAQIDEIYFNNAIRMAQFTYPEIAMQYLADKNAIPNEPPYVGQDLTPREEVMDVQAPAEEDLNAEGQTQAAEETEEIVTGPEGTADEGPVKSIYNPRVRIDRDGKVTHLSAPMRVSLRPFVQRGWGGYP